MRAAVFHRYGPPEVVKIEEVPIPSPKEDEILVRIRATAVNSGDARLRSLNVPTGFGLAMRLAMGFTRPRQPILGTELAGEVEAVGGKVTRFKVGDPVVAYCGVGMRCHAEYRCVRESSSVELKPEGLSFEEATTLGFGGATAVDFLKKAALRTGESVLVNGASGAVGTAMVQVARHKGAEVTGVCSGANAELVRSLGAHHVIDYTQEDFTRNGKRYDVIVDTAGTAPFSCSRGSLPKGGRLLLIQAGLPEMLKAPWNSVTSGRKVIAGMAAERAEDFRLIVELAASGEFRPVVDSTYPLEQIAEAHRRVDTGHKRGSVVITVG